MAVMCWAAQNRARLPALRWLYHVPNGGSRHKAEAGKLKAMGVKKGVPDLHLDVCMGDWTGLIIEMKRADEDHNAVTPEQVEWLDHAREQGRIAVVCFGWRQAVAQLEAYLDADAH